jgi:glutaredoxin
MIMKKILPICIVGILLFTAFGAVAQTNNVKNNNSNLVKRDFTHTVFAELGTATWCGYCHFARESLDKICTNQDYPFYYVSLVDDMNTHAAERNLELNIGAFPTVIFDYGYQVVVGGWPGAEAEHRAAIIECGNRTVADIDINLNVAWLGDATIDISVEVTNNEATLYGGHLHVYVCEIESSLGWKDTAGHVYTFPFLDYAFNEPISIADGDTWTDSVIWDGHDYNNGNGKDFGSIQFGNIAVIASVFNDTWHQGYAYPPFASPFDAYWVDETAGVLVAAPKIPSNPDPADGATSVDINKYISWTGSLGDAITYDVYFGTESTPPKVANNQSATTYNPGTLSYSTKYYWKIVTYNEYGNSTEGPIWSFMTALNNAPDDPIIMGTDTGKPGNTYDYTIIGTDSDNDMVSAYIMWGDDTITDWTTFHESGESFIVSHSWAEKGTYTVQVKVKDVYGIESGWTTLDVKMPKSLDINNLFLHWYSNISPVHSQYSAISSEPNESIPTFFFLFYYTFLSFFIFTDFELIV